MSLSLALLLVRLLSICARPVTQYNKLDLLQAEDGSARDIQALADEKQMRDSGANPGCESIAWVHFPKAGTSFGTALAHCANRSLPADAKILPCEKSGSACEILQEVEFTQRYPLDQWFKGIFWEKGGNFGGHVAVTNHVWQLYQGKMFGMFRDPVKRAMSAYEWFAEEGTDGGKRPSPSQYAQRIKGTVAKMLAGQVSHVIVRGSEYV
jgi:hypothetical protein